MALTEILLLKPVENLGSEGDQIKVRAGYARNYLLPQGIALPVSRANRRHIEALQKARIVREARELESAQSLATALAAVSLVFPVKTGEGGKMFGAVTTADIAAKLTAQGLDIDRKRIHLPHGSVKGIGKHTAHIKLHSTLTHEFEFEVVSENPVEELPEAPSAVDDEPRERRGARKHISKGE